MVTSLVNEGELIRIHTGTAAATTSRSSVAVTSCSRALGDAYITQETAKAIYGLGEVNGV